MYYLAAVGIVYDPVSHTQVFYEVRYWIYRSAFGSTLDLVSHTQVFYEVRSRSFLKICSWFRSGTWQQIRGATPRSAFLAADPWINT